ncbi:AI-2E family transporter [Dyella solisilvae]|uniref:AI-2E family transporter n=1 Tax=Dyella solisilvae TaxID=1920168 RepID=A0A370K517_9GAMM|nr:AI-2E family transporter [Dyella solisilvae]RDI97752.1 AI-2E family transporter [Dyella solisilvae]
MSSPASDVPATSAGQRAVVIVAAGTVLALLYVGREVLVPVVLAFFLSLLLAPWVRLYRRLGLGHGLSVLVAVIAFVVIGTGLASMMGSQVVHMARGLPQYEATIRGKVTTLREMTLGRFEIMQGEVGKVINQAEGTLPAAPSAPEHPSASPESPASEAGSVHRPTTPMEVMTRVLSTAWIPLQTAGIVLVVLVFVLLEQESLRDRFIRLAGGSDLRATTAAINDAGARLSRFFLSTFSVNFGVGVAIWLGLTVIGVPNAPLWGCLTAVLRFVPYVGVWMVAALVALFAAAVTPGWSLLVMTLVLYFVVELVVSQLVEPFLYGHTTGLSPLAVVVSAIFWSWLWGPVGLVMSTPLTLCLVVAGRHVEGLNLLNVLLGDAPALTMPQRFYQRALSGDAHEILAEARSFLKRKTFAAYGDSVLLPAMQLGRIDLMRGAISREQQNVLRDAVVKVVETLGHDRSRWSLRRMRPTVLDDASIGRRLRQMRVDVAGRWQGSLAVAPGTLVLCVGLGSVVDDLATEMLTRVLRDLHIDARHLAPDDFAAFDAEPHPEATPDAVSLAYVVSADATAERADCEAMSATLRQRMPGVRIVALLLPEPLVTTDAVVPLGADFDAVTRSLEEAAQQAIALFPADGAGLTPH